MMTAHCGEFVKETCPRRQTFRLAWLEESCKPYENTSPIVTKIPNFMREESWFETQYSNLLLPAFLRKSQQITLTLQSKWIPEVTLCIPCDFQYYSPQEVNEDETHVISQRDVSHMCRHRYEWCPSAYVQFNGSYLLCAS